MDSSLLESGIPSSSESDTSLILLFLSLTSQSEQSWLTINGSDGFLQMIGGSCIKDPHNDKPL